MRKYNVLVTSAAFIIFAVIILIMIGEMTPTTTPGNGETVTEAEVKEVPKYTVFEIITAEAESETETETESATRDTDNNAPKMDENELFIDDICENAAITQHKDYFDVPLGEDLQDHIFDICEEYGIPPEIIIAQISRESCFDPDVVGAAGEVGYLQIHPVTVTFITGETGLDVSDPRENISAGAWLLHYFIDRGYSLNEALICYNEGEGNALGLFNQGIHSTTYSLEICALAEEIAATRKYTG